MFYLLICLFIDLFIDLGIDQYGSVSQVNRDQYGSAKAHGDGGVPCRRNAAFGESNACFGEQHLREVVAPEFRKRLVAWEAAGAELLAKAAQKAIGGLLLCWYASDIVAGP